MIRVEYQITMPFSYNAKTRRYYYHGCSGNCGDWLEAVLKFKRGQADYYKKDSEPYWKSSDIQQEKASVKSSRATLARIFGDDFDKICEEYFSKVCSENWYFVTYNKEKTKVTEWRMNRKEFKEFIFTFGRLEKESRSLKKKIRFKEYNKEMQKWFNERVD